MRERESFQSKPTFFIIKKMMIIGVKEIWTLKISVFETPENVN